MKSRNEISAGGVVYRRGPGGIEIIIGKASSYQRWVLPKGLVNPGESYEETAVREVEEEAGVKVRLIAPLGEPERYIYTARGVRVFKEVHYYLMEYVDGSEQDHDKEMDEVRWVPIDEALSLLAYESARNVVRRAQAALAEQAGGCSRCSPAPYQERQQIRPGAEAGPCASPGKLVLVIHAPLAGAAPVVVPLREVEVRRDRARE